MTETVAVATLGVPERGSRCGYRPRSGTPVIAKQGKSVFGVEIKVVDEHGATLPRDGQSQGELMVRGQWIVRQLLQERQLAAAWRAGFPPAISPPSMRRGVMQIRDRAKDLIKTGGEWISSIDLENTAVAHPAVAAAAVIGVKHPKWQETAAAVRRAQARAILWSREEILEFLVAAAGASVRAG